MEIDEFTRAYIDAILWAETDGDDDPLDENHDVRSFAPGSLERIISDCRLFQELNAEDFRLVAESGWKPPGQCSVLEYAGHDFWLTRQGHGCGFWDGDWPEEVGVRLTESAGSFGECYVYEGDDGMLYLGGGTQ